VISGGQLNLTEIRIVPMPRLVYKVNGPIWRSRQGYFRVIFGR
jgi:hypothetical protein